MVAPPQYYITQAVNTDDRLYVRERMLLSGDSVSEWRIATAGEKDEYEAAQAAELFEF